MHEETGTDMAQGVHSSCQPTNASQEHVHVVNCASRSDSEFPCRGFHRPTCSEFTLSFLSCRIPRSGVQEGSKLLTTFYSFLAFWAVGVTLYYFSPPTSQSPSMTQNNGSAQSLHLFYLEGCSLSLEGEERRKTQFSFRD